jgi:hypothetical protein
MPLGITLHADRVGLLELGDRMGDLPHPINESQRKASAEKEHSYAQMLVHDAPSFGDIWTG